MAEDTKRKRLARIVDSASEPKPEPVVGIELDHTPDKAIEYLTRSIKQVAQKGKGAEDGKYGATRITGVLKVFTE